MHVAITGMHMQGNKDAAFQHGLVNLVQTCLLYTSRCV